jgi:hexosaminidase
VRVSFEPPPPGQVIRYTVDGREPGHDAATYTEPFLVESTGRVTAAVFTAMGRRSAPVTVDVVRWRPEAEAAPEALEPGLRVEAFPGAFSRVPAFQGLEPAWAADVDGFAFAGKEPADDFALRFTGYLRVDAPGLRTFTLGSDDGSVLRIAGALVVSNDGLHGFATRTGRVHLAPGLYPVELGYFERGGAQRLEVAVEGGGTLLRPVTKAD